MEWLLIYYGAVAVLLAYATLVRLSTSLHQGVAAFFALLFAATWPIMFPIIIVMMIAKPSEGKKPGSL